MAVCVGTMGDSLQTDSLLDQLLEEVHQLRLILNGRLGSLENNVCFLSNTCNGMAAKLESVEGLMQRTHDVLQASEAMLAQSSSSSSGYNRCSDPSNTSNSVAEGSSNSRAAGGGSENGGAGILATAAGVLRLPGVEDYPEGTWLGDPDSPSKRVRSPITPQNLLHINSTCVTAEKMALTLLDYLFSRDELASSNISGRSRNNKKQLDPMMVYGIRCHLQYKFNITSKEWSRICQNMDSKCRSAWKRKIKNLGLSSTNLQHNKIIKVCHGPIRTKEPNISEDISFDFEQLHPSGLDLGCVKVMADNPCELRILHHAGHGTLDPLANTHEIVLAEDRILASAAVEEKDVSSSSLLMGRGGSSTRLSVTPVVITGDALGGLTGTTSLQSLPSSATVQTGGTLVTSVGPHHQMIAVSGPHSHHQTLTVSDQHHHQTLDISDHQTLAVSVHDRHTGLSMSGQDVHHTLNDVASSAAQVVVHQQLSPLIASTARSSSHSTGNSNDSLQGDLQQCSVSLSCSPLSLHECTEEDQQDDLSRHSPSLETSEGVIVISGDPSADDGDGILEIGVGTDSLPAHLQDSPTSSSPSSPGYKLLPSSHSSFHASLNLPSSGIKHEMEDQVIADDLDESMQSIHQSSLHHHLSMSSLGVIRVKEDMDLKDDSTLDH